MGGHRQREKRISVIEPVRLRCDEGWLDATIGNVSSRGVMLRGSSLPPKGSFIEVRHGSQVLVGRVVWSRSNACGVRTQDVIDIPALLCRDHVQPRKAGVERRKPSRPA